MSVSSLPKKARAKPVSTGPFQRNLTDFAKVHEAGLQGGVKEVLVPLLDTALATIVDRTVATAHQREADARAIHD